MTRRSVCGSCRFGLPTRVRSEKPSDGDRSSGRLFTKTYKVKNGLLQKLHRNFPSDVVPMALTAHDLISAVECLKRAEADDGGYCMILALLIRGTSAFSTGSRGAGTSVERRKSSSARSTALVLCRGSHRHLVAIDSIRRTPTHGARALALMSMPIPMARFAHASSNSSPKNLKRCAFAYQLWADKPKCGQDRRRAMWDPSKIKFHIFLWLKTPRLPSVVKAWVQARDRENVAADFGGIKGSSSASGRAGSISLSTKACRHSLSRSDLRVATIRSRASAGGSSPGTRSTLMRSPTSTNASKVRSVSATASRRLRADAANK